MLQVATAGSHSFKGLVSVAPSLQKNPAPHRPTLLAASVDFNFIGARAEAPGTVQANVAAHLMQSVAGTSAVPIGLKSVAPVVARMYPTGQGWNNFRCCPVLQ